MLLAKFHAAFVETVPNIQVAVRFWGSGSAAPDGLARACRIGRLPTLNVDAALYHFGTRGSDTQSRS